MLSCSHHRRDTLTTGWQVARSLRSIIGCVTKYSATVICLLVTDFLIPSKTASLSDSSRSGYSQLPSVRRLCGCFPVMLLVILFWNRQGKAPSSGWGHTSPPQTATPTGPPPCKNFPTHSDLPPTSSESKITDPDSFAPSQDCLPLQASHRLPPSTPYSGI